MSFSIFSFAEERTRLISTHGLVESWDVSEVTNMTGLFENNLWFNEDIRAWNTSAVVDMAYMFSGASTFNQPLGSWDTAAVTTHGEHVRLHHGLQPTSRFLEHFCGDYHEGHPRGGARATARELTWLQIPPTTGHLPRSTA